MAGGMTPGRGVPIGQRPVVPPGGTIPPEPPAPLERVDDVPPGPDPAACDPAGGCVAGPGPAAHPRHVWVADPDGSRHPGVLVEQARNGQGEWLALVVSVVEFPAGGAYTRQGWVPARTVTPCDT